MCLCVYASVHVYVYIYVYTCLYAYTCTYPLYAYMIVRIKNCAYIYIYICIYVHVYIDIDTYNVTYIYICIAFLPRPIKMQQHEMPTHNRAHHHPKPQTTLSTSNHTAQTPCNLESHMKELRNARLLAARSPWPGLPPGTEGMIRVHLSAVWGLYG